MSARTRSEIAAIRDDIFRARRPRTSQPVHRNSYHAGEREVRPWRQHNMFAATEHNARMRAAEEFDDLTRMPGRRNGALGHIALQVYRRLLRLRGRKTGRLDPTYAWLAAELNRSRSAVFRAMTRLKEHGFLDWLRRTQPVEDPEPDGQYVEQISNAYVLELRGVAAELVRRITRRPSEKLRRVIEEKRRALREAMPIEALLAAVVDDELRSVLKSFNEVLLESANPPRPIKDSM